jgi:phospholipid/cholesterol/gamma-HCH transport system substrate-binding protein
VRLRLLLLLLVAALAVSTAACGVFGNNDGRTYEIEFERAFNLFEGSRVKVQGVDVGSVERMDVEPGGTNVIATVLVHDDEVRIPAEAEAVIVQGALLGERYIQFHPPYDGGEELEDGDRIPVERTTMPVEFDESFAALNDALESLDKDEVARLIRNVADMLDGQGEDLGTLLEDARDLIVALRQSDDELVDLVSTMADLQETVSTRAEGLADQYVNLGILAESLSSERAQLDRALEALLRMTTEVGDVVATHGETLEQDVATLTRLGRTTNRNLDRFAHWYQYQAELFRHTARPGVAPPERNWATTRNHYDAIPVMITQRINERLAGLCEVNELDECAELGFWEELNADEMCLPPLVPCPEDAEGNAVGDQLQQAFEAVPELRERLSERELQDQQLLDEIDTALRNQPRQEEQEEQEERNTSTRLRDGWETRVGSTLSEGLR